MIQSYIWFANFILLAFASSCNSLDNIAILYETLKQAIPQFIYNIANIVSKSFHNFYYETDTYLFSWLVSLKCSMDVQSSNGRSLLLKYVSSYVTKMKDHKLLKGLIHFTRNLYLYESSYILYLIKYIIYISIYYFLNFNSRFFVKCLSYTYTLFYSLYVF